MASGGCGHEEGMASGRAGTGGVRMVEQMI